jgi:hypothetical protein
MSVDEAQSTGFGQEVATPRRRRRRHHRHLMKRLGGKRLQRILAILFLGSLVIAASLWFSQNFTEYEPPPHVYDR